MPRDLGNYILVTDSPDFGLGAVLSRVQNSVERHIAHASRSLNTAEKLYCTTGKELLAAVYGLKQYNQYLLDRSLPQETTTPLFSGFVGQANQ